MIEPEYEHAVGNGVIHHVSPSQIETFDPETYGGCPTRWYFGKVLRVPVVQTKAQAGGTAMHAENQAYLETGIDTLGRVARAGKHFMPRPREWILVEHDAGKDHPVYVAGVKVDQRIDLVNYSETYKDDNGDEHDDPGCVEVVDWKSTSSMDYAKSAEELRKSVQMLSYAVWVASQAARWERDLSAPLQRVRLSHGVFRTTGAALARKTTTSIGLGELAGKWQRIEGVVESMKGVARLKVVADAPRNLDACDAYRGCPFKDICPRPAFSDFSFLEGGSNVGMFDDMFSSATTKQVAELDTSRGVERVPVRVITEMAAPVLAKLAPNDGAVHAEIEKLKAEEAAAKGKPTPEELKEIVERHVAGHGKRSVGVLPDDAPPVTGAAAAEPIPPEVLATMHPAIQKAAEALVAEGATVVYKAPDVGPGEGHTGGTIVVSPAFAASDPRTRVQEAVAEIAAEKSKARRGRPPKVDKTPPTVAEKQAVAALLDAAIAGDVVAALEEAGANPRIGSELDVARMATTGEVEALNTPKATGFITTDPSYPDKTRIVKERADITIVDGRIEREVRNGLTVFADVSLAGIAADDLEPYVADIMRKMEKQFGVADVRFTPKDSPLAYGGWKGALAAGVRAMPPAPGVYRLAFVRGNEVRELVLEALQSAGAAIARGV